MLVCNILSQIGLISFALANSLLAAISLASNRRYNFFAHKLGQCKPGSKRQHEKKKNIQFCLCDEMTWISMGLMVRVCRVSDF